MLKCKTLLDKSSKSHSEIPKVQLAGLVKVNVLASSLEEEKIYHLDNHAYALWHFQEMAQLEEILLQHLPIILLKAKISICFLFYVSSVFCFFAVLCVYILFF